MPATTKDTKIKPSGRGGPRKGSGRKSAGKKNYTYFLDPEIGEWVREKENPSKYVEEALRLVMKVETDLDKTLL